jgi:diguanylate cyclase (GGDEF)-like protein
VVASARAVGAWRLLCVALVTAYVVIAAWRHGRPYSVPIDGVLYTAVYVAAALCCFARAGRAGESAGAWRLFGAGIAAYAFGWAVLPYWLVHMPVQPIPSLADVGWLAMYPLALAGIVRIIGQVRSDRSSALPLLDASVAGLGAATVCAVVVLPYLATTPSGSWLTTAVDAAYPCGDLLLVAGLMATLVVARFRVPPTLWVLLGAALTLVCVDSLYLTGVADGSFHEGILSMYAAWAVVAVVIAGCSGTSFTARAPAMPTSLAVQSVPAFATLSSLVVLLFRRSGPSEALIATLAALTIALAVVRLMLSYREARALADSQQLAQTDELTGLVNRRGFQEAAARRLRAAEGSLAVLLVDLDGFKDINDGLGHPTGDDLLRALGRRLGRESRNGNLVARIGGDEFAVLADDTDGSATVVAERLLALIRRPFLMHSMELRVDASIGIASSPQHGTTLDDLLRHADIAMYRAKGRHIGVLRHTPEHDPTPASLRLAAQLRHAIENDPVQLVVHYQPKVHLMSGHLAGVEALVRWQHPERGLLLPGQFLALAEKSRLMGTLTERVLERVFAEMSTWKGELSGQPVSVNLAADSVSDPTLVDRVSQLLAETGTSPRRLQLEITEDFLMADLAGARIVLDKLRALGISISIDDYGTGYSSLAYLRDLPVDELKLDRAFVQPILSDPRAAAIVRSTVDLAHSLGLRMVAEGIEDADTWHRLLAIGCDIGQGYLFGRPQSAADLAATLRAANVVLDPASGESVLWQADGRAALRSPA